MARFVRKDRQIYEHSHCCLCGTGYGGGSAKQGNKCPRTVCRACGSAQCLYNGLGRGTCSVCLIGLLDGYRIPKCGYSKCGQDAVASAPRVGYCCADHAKRAGVADRITRYFADRDKQWVAVSDGYHDEQELEGVKGA